MSLLMKKLEIVAPAPGRLLALSDVPDAVFAGGLLGDGFAVDPSAGEFCAPVSGELVLLADTLHAFAVRTRHGFDVLVHVGIDTVALRGAGFTPLVSVGHKVRRGDPVLRVDLDAVRDHVPSMISPVVITAGPSGTVDLRLDAPWGAPVYLRRFRP